MKFQFVPAALALTLTAAAGSAHAGVYADDLTRCLVKSTSAADQQVLVKWVYSALSAHPTVNGYSTLTATQDEAMAKDAGQLMQRLLTVDCRKETRDALKYEGADAFGTAFEALGGAAMSSIMTDPKVAANIARVQSHIDLPAIMAVAAEAGAPATPAAPAK
jgi:hypothetical protein